MQSDLRSLLFVETEALALDLDLGHAVLIGFESADKGFLPVHGLVELHLDLAAQEGLEVARAFELALDTRRAYLKDIALRDRIGLVQDGIETAGNALAVS